MANKLEKTPDLKRHLDDMETAKRQFEESYVNLKASASALHIALDIISERTNKALSDTARHFRGEKID